MSDVLTPAEKAKITRAFNAAQERKAQAAFEAESERTGGRKAKQDAKTNAVWLAKELKSDPKDKTQPKDSAKAKNQADDKIESRKRTSSSVAVADRPKKAKETPADKSGEQEVLTGGKSKAKVKTRKHAAPAIAIDTDDEDEPQQKTVKAKTKTATKASKTPVVPVKAVKPTAALKPAKLVPDSNSESESSDDSEEHNVSDAGAPNAEEFLIEAPRIIGKRKSVPIVSDKEDNEMPDAPPRAAQDLFDDDRDSDGVMEDPLLEALKRASELKAKKGQLSDDDMAGFDSDREFHEEMAKSTRYIERSEARGRSLSTGSWSSGHGLDVPDTDDEGLADFALYDESGDEEEPAAKPKKTRKVSAARQKKANLERPQVRAASQIKSEPQASIPLSRPESSYHESARFVNPPPGKDVRLNDQPDACKAVVRGAIALLKISIFCENSYMQILSRTGFGKGLPGPRLMTDPKYLAVLADLLVDRVNIIRGSVKKLAASLAPGLYKILGLTSEATMKLIEELLKDHRYIFGVDPHTSRIKTDEPFLHAAIIAVIKQAILTGAFKAQVEHLFVSTNPDYPDRLELPDAMVCIATTAVRILAYPSIFSI
ncbi:hypothetical protein B0H14DRAFT_3486784 [Mycena olivaceomarginata]|nr:hypothetical protein B0H14DRAFT_3486784 [Mycena olivaceomarginata]